MSLFRGHIPTATFIANGHRYTQGPIEGVYLVQYKIIPCPYPQDPVHSENGRLRYQSHAELILHPSAAGARLNDEETVSRLIVHSGYSLL